MKARVESRAFAVAAFVLVSACSVEGGALGPSGGAGSDLTSVSIGLPDRGGLKSQVADIETKMNAYHLVIAPVDAGCPDATKVNHIADWTSNNPVLGASLRQGCDYDVTLSLGQKAQGGGSQPQPQPQPAESKPSYEGKAKGILDASCVSCHRSGGTPPDLSSFSAAKSRGARIIARSTAGTMPPGGGLAQADRDLLKAWADGGYLEKDSTPPPPPPSGGSQVDTSKLAAVYFKNNTALRVKKEDIAGKAEYKAPLKLQLQADGEAIGLGKANGGGGTPPPPQPNPPPPQPVAPSVNIPADRDFSFTDSSGAEVALSKAMKTKYMLLDFSSSTCGYCLQRAGEMNRDTSLQAKLSSETCSHATIVPQGDLQGWLRASGSSNFTSKHSYAATTGRVGKLVEAFGVRFAGTPTFLMIDTDGKVVAESNGIPTSEINQYCK